MREQANQHASYLGASFCAYRSRPELCFTKIYRSAGCDRCRSDTGRATRFRETATRLALPAGGQPDRFGLLLIRSDETSSFTCPTAATCGNIRYSGPRIHFCSRHFGLHDWFPAGDVKQLLRDLIGQRANRHIQCRPVCRRRVKLSPTSLRLVRKHLDSIRLIDEQRGGGTPDCSGFTQAMRIPRMTDISRSVFGYRWYISAEDGVFDYIAKT